jgi:peptidoglycan-associated lipoprotein
MSLYQNAGRLKFAALLGAALAIGACAKTPGEEGLAGLGAGGGGGYGNGHGSGAPGSQEDFAQNVGDRVFFESDQTDLTPKGQATLDKQARWLQQYNRDSITVEGHADERGTREYNFALGARRAESTKEYLVARGIPASRIRTISYGKERPVATCNDISCWSQNRRAVTVIGGGQS